MSKCVSPTPKIYVAVLIPSISEHVLMWKQGFCRGNQGKMRSLDGPWFNMTGIPTRKKKKEIWAERQMYIAKMM